MREAQNQKSIRANGRKNVNERDKEGVVILRGLHRNVQRCFCENGFALVWVALICAAGEIQRIFQHFFDEIHDPCYTFCPAVVPFFQFLPQLFHQNLDMAACQVKSLAHNNTIRPDEYKFSIEQVNCIMQLIQSALILDTG